MTNLANKELDFIVNGEKIKLEPISQYFFDESYDDGWGNISREDDRDNVDYITVVSLAISKFLGYTVFATHRSGNIAFAAVDKNGSFCGNFTVYSDYIGINTIDNYTYQQNLKDIA